MESQTEVCVCLSARDRTVFSQQYLFIDIAEELSSISEYVKDKQKTQKRSLETMLKKEYCKERIESVYEKIHDEGLKNDLFIPLVK